MKLWGEADLEGRKNDLFFGHDTCEVIGNILDFFICKGDNNSTPGVVRG